MRRLQKLLLLSKQLLPLSIGVTGIAISILDFTNVLDSGWFDDNAVGITLLVVSALATHLTLSYEPRVNEMDVRLTDGNSAMKQLVTDLPRLIEGRIDRAEQMLLQAVSSPTIKVFRDTTEYWTYCSARIQNASKMSDLTWGESPARWRTDAEREAYNRYRELIRTESTSGTKVREIFTFDYPMRLKRLFDVIDSPGTGGYSARYYDIAGQLYPPLIQLTIFDDTEVLFGPHRGDALDPADELYMAISDPSVVRLCLDYFEACWMKALKIKDGVIYNDAELERVRALHEIQNG